MVDGPWTIAGTVLAGVVLVVTLIALGFQIDAQFWAPKRKEKKRLAALKNPADAHFFVINKTARRVSWAVQDNADHYLKEIVLQSNSETTVDIAISPRVHFKSTGILFGCGSSAKLSEKPYAIRQENHFISKGSDKICKPGEHPNHSIMTTLYYQVKEERSWNVGTDIIRGFTIKTRKSGKYEMEYAFIGGEIEGAAKLTIRVEDDGPFNMVDVHGETVRPVFKRR